MSSEGVTCKLEENNLKVISFDFSTEAANDEEFAYAITQAKEAWNKAKEDMYKEGMVSEKEKAKFTTTLGSVLNQIAEKTGADASLLIQYNGFQKSDGAIAKDIAAGVLLAVLTGAVAVQPTEGAVVDIALVDNSSGKVIWADRRGSTVANASPAGQI